MIKKLQNSAILINKVADDKLRKIFSFQNGFLKNQKENEVLLEALSSSFNSDFVDNGVLKELSEAILKQSSAMIDGRYPYIPLFQSSGYGKSKLIYELAQKEFFTIYWCLRTGTSGFPIQSSAIVENLDSLVRDFARSFLSPLSSLIYYLSSLISLISLVSFRFKLFLILCHL